MLSRILEPEIMDSRQEAADYDAMDHAEVNRAFVADLLAARDCLYDPAAKPASANPIDAQFGDWDDQPIFDVLDLGTGTARIPIELCQQFERRNGDELHDAAVQPGRREDDQEEPGVCERIRILAVDLAASMLDLARLNLEIASLMDQVQLEQVDAKQTPFADGMFDCVMSNSIIHHLPAPEGALAESVRVCRPGGLLFFRDLLRPDTEEQTLHLVSAYAGKENDHQRRMFEDSLRAALSLEEIRDLVSRLGFDSNTVQQTTDRHWTWAATKPDD